MGTLRSQNLQRHAKGPASGARGLCAVAVRPWRLAAPFGVTQVGYTDVTSYAYPGGLALGFINPNPEG